MDAPDTSDIDLDPAHFRCPADLWYRLHQLHEKVKAEYPSYEDLSELTGVPRATLYDLLGENSKTRNNKNKPLWDTVKPVVRGCGVPETELERWEAAWEASVAQDKPTWPEEQQQLLAEINQLATCLATANTRTSQLAADLAEAKARIDQLTKNFATADTYIDQLTTVIAQGKTRTDQLTADLAVAEARAMDAEKALAAYHHVPSLPAPIEQFRIRAQTYYDARDYTGAIKLYRQIAAEVEREYGPGDPRTLQAQRRHLEVKTEDFKEKQTEILPNAWLQFFTRRKLSARWRHLICEHQRCLPEGDRMTLELRLEHIYWMAKLLNPRKVSLSPARKLLIALHADCKLFLPPGDPFTAEVARYMNIQDWEFKRPERQQWIPKPRPQRQARSSVSDAFQHGGADRDN